VTTGAGVTVTVALEVAVFEASKQLMEYVVVVAGDTSKLPDVEVALVHGAAHDVAPVETHVNVDVAPRVIVVGLAVKLTVNELPPPPPVVTVTVAVDEALP
jgi:hypothetical protein